MVATVVIISCGVVGKKKDGVVLVIVVVGMVEEKGNEAASESVPVEENALVERGERCS